MDLNEQLRILHETGGNQALLALTTVDLAHSALSIDERAEIKTALMAAAVPHWCDSAFLSAMLMTTLKESDGLLERLRTLTVVEGFPARGDGTINVHEATRLALRQHLRTTDEQRWTTLSSRARNHLANREEPHARIEALYHLFAVNQSQAAIACETMAREFTAGAQLELRHALAVALGELNAAGWLTGAAQVEASLPALDIRIWRGEAAQIEDEVRRVVALASSSSHVSGIARAKCILGDVLVTLGRLDDALTAYRDFQESSQELVASDPTNLGWRRDLAVSYSRLGSVAKAQGRLEDAAIAFQEYREILRRVAASAPANVGWQRGLAVAHSLVSDVAQAQGRLADASAAFDEYEAILQRLVDSDPLNMDWQRELATGHAQAARIERAHGRLDLAEKRYRDALRIVESLVASDPTNASWSRDLATTHSRMAGIMKAQNRLDESADSYREALRILTRLAASDPSSATLQNDVAIAYSNVGAIAYAQRRFEEADVALRASEAILQRLVAKDPSNANWEHGLAGARQWLEVIAQAQGND
jgi:tetratricopeptide (TPR) repeat protein